MRPYVKIEHNFFFNEKHYLSISLIRWNGMSYGGIYSQAEIYKKSFQLAKREDKLQLWKYDKFSH